MKLLFTVLFLFILSIANAQSICNQNGNLIIYSNYDGGIVTINVDQNIPNLKIGICTYEPVQVTLTGPYLSNVTQVVYGGFNSTQGNNNCGLGDFPTTISGVNSSIVSINTYPAIGYDNPNGWPNMVGVAGACSSTQNAGGANTPDQVVYYFQQVTGGTFYAHYTQYACWLNTVYNVSAGGNCCVIPNSTCVAPIADAGTNTSICAGSSITLGGSPTASGGSSSNYTYSWSPSLGLSDPTSANPTVSPTSNTTYTVTVSNGDISCSSTASIDVTIGSQQTLPVTVNGSLILCPNQTTQLIADPSFSNYQWSNNQTSNSIVVSTAGTYSVTAQSSSGCPAVSQNFTFTQDAPFSVNVTPSGTIQLCGNESVSLTAQAGYSNYVWSNAQNGATLNVNQSGAYSVSAQNANGCSGTSSVVQVNVDPIPQATFTYNQLDEYTVQFTCTEPNATAWLWNFGSGNTSILENPQFDFLYDNNWPVSLSVTNDCGSDTLNTLVTVIKSGLNDLFPFEFNLIQQSETMLVKGNVAYPQKVNIQLITIQGQILESRNLVLQPNWQFEIPIQSYAQGIYFLRISNENGMNVKPWVKN